jgi:hypothetical protein
MKTFDFIEATISHQLKDPHSKVLEPDCLSPLASNYDTASRGRGELGAPQLCCGVLPRIVYKVYLCDDEMNASELIGVLPEMRTGPERIDMESVMKWSEAVFGEKTDVKGFLFLQATVT